MSVTEFRAKDPAGGLEYQPKYLLPGDMIFVLLINATSRSAPPRLELRQGSLLPLCPDATCATLTAVPLPALIGDALAAARDGDPLVIAVPAVFPPRVVTESLLP